MLSIAETERSTFPFLSRIVSTRYARWLNKRIPPANKVVLTLRNVFIFPTATGFGFGAFLVLLVVGAANYQSSLFYGVAFLLASLFLVTIFYTYRNLAGISLELVRSKPGFAGESAEFEIRIQRPSGTGRDGIRVGWPNAVKQWVEIVDHTTKIVRLFVPAAERGWLNPGRLQVETCYPLGLLRAWSWIDLNARVVVYPRPIFGVQTKTSTVISDDGPPLVPHGSDDFTDTRVYRPGDPVRHVMWRAYARSDELNVKTYDSFVDDRFWLDFDSVSGNIEERLSVLAGQALDAYRKNREFGLRLPSVSIPINIDESHLNQVLRGLALYEKPI